MGVAVAGLPHIASAVGLDPHRIDVEQDRTAKEAVKFLTLGFHDSRDFRMLTPARRRQKAWH